MKCRNCGHSVHPAEVACSQCSTIKPINKIAIFKPSMEALWCFAAAVVGLIAFESFALIHSHGPHATKAVALAARMNRDGHAEPYSAFLREFGEGDAQGSETTTKNGTVAVEYPTDDGYVKVVRNDNAKSFIRATPIKQWPD